MEALELTVLRLELGRSFAHQPLQPESPEQRRGRYDQRARSDLARTVLKEIQQSLGARDQHQGQTEQERESRGGGAVKATMTGGMELVSIEIDPEVVDPEDVEMLQDMVMAAVNEAMNSSQELANKKLGGVTGGMGGLFDRPNYPEGHIFRTATERLAIFASDNISSSAYATEEIMRVLAIAGTAADIAAIQIQKGYASVLDGPGAMGGAINLVTMKPTKPGSL